MGSDGQDATELRCPACGRLLAKVRATGEIEIRCPRCNTTVREDLYQVSYPKGYGGDVAGRAGDVL